MRTHRLAVLLLLLLAGGCAPSRLIGALHEARVPADATWESRSADPTEAQARHCKAAWDWAEEDTGNLGLVVVHNGRLVFERYHSEPGTPRHWGPNRTTHVFSATKSLAGMLVGAAVKGGLLELDQPVHELLPGLLEGREGDDLEWARAMTIEHLLSLTSGLEAPSFGYFADLLAPIDRQGFYSVTDYLLGLDLGMEHPPGEGWLYFSGQLELVSAVLGAALAGSGKTVQEFAREKIFDPVGFRYSRWSEDAAGNPFLFLGMFTSARDMAKLGQLFLTPGDVLPDDWLARATEGSEANEGYGLTLWLNRPSSFNTLGFRTGDDDPPWPHAPADTAMMSGFKNNYVVIIESLGLVVVRLSDWEMGSWDDDEFFEKLLGDDRGEGLWRERAR